MTGAVIEDRPGDLIPAIARAEIASGMAGYSLAVITQLFATARFRAPDDIDLGQGQMRRTLVAAIDDTIDFGSPEQAQRYLSVVERLLDQLDDTAAAASHPWAADTRRKILRELARVNIDPDQRGRLLLPARFTAGRTLASAPDESGIRLAITMLERSDAEPEERIGSAKELIEATVKFALDELGEGYGPAEDLGALAKRLLSRLKVDPAGVAPTAKGAETIVRVLGGLWSIPVGMAELRNAGYGTGHGRAQRISGIKPRHAELAVRSAVAYATFILETLRDPEAPWR